MFVTGLVLAAGASQRLGRPKQLLPYRGSTLLGATLVLARACGFDQLIVTLGWDGVAIRELVDLAGAEVVQNRVYGGGCGSSIGAAMGSVDPLAIGLVLLLGDQPGVTVGSVRGLVEQAGGGPLGVCRYANGLGHPFWLGREVFGELEVLHGDRAVWKVLHSGQYDVTESAVEGPVPLDVDTWQDYKALLAQEARP
jgi:molybdenum cofactor cytidylyltransferase